MIKILQKIKKKEVEPNIYAIVIDSDTGEGVTQVIAYTLDEAIQLAKQDAVRNLRCDIGTCHVRYWNILPLDALKDKIFTMEVEDLDRGPERSVTVSKDLNGIMKKIIETGDVQLFKRMKRRLSPNEIEYIKQKLSI